MLKTTTSTENAEKIKFQENADKTKFSAHWWLDKTYRTMQKKPNFKDIAE